MPKPVFARQIMPPLDVTSANFFFQDCCRSMRIGKILVDSHPDTHEARVIFAKFPSDIAERKVLLLYPIMSSGNKVCRAMQVLKENRVRLI